MVTRILPPDEWPRLMGTEAQALWPHLDAGRSTILVVEDEGEIIGTWALMNVLHAECLWIAPAHRGKSSVARRLWTALVKTAKERSAPTVATSALTDDVKALLAHVGAVKLDGDHYVMRMPCLPQ